MSARPPTDQIDTRYAITSDGIYLCYQTLGEGPIDIVWQPDWPGNIDMTWDAPIIGPWLRELSTFGRVIMHDHRGVGLSSRNVPVPTIEQRVEDLRVVLDAARAANPVLVGLFSSGAVHAMLAATDPGRARALVWIEPSARSAWSPDYPWGAGPDYHAAEQRTLETWGTAGYGVAHLEHERAVGNDMPIEFAEYESRQTRNACTPDVAREMAAIWYETDVRGVLPAVRCPTLLLPRAAPDGSECEYIASLIPGAEIRELPAGPWSDATMSAELAELRAFIGVEPPSTEPESVLAAVLFTDIVGSTERQAALGDAAWKQLVERHHAIVREEIERWKGDEVDTAGDGFYATFGGPARAVRCALSIEDRVHDLGLRIRAGVHVGECTVINEKVGGLPVTIGARIASQAGPSEVLVSQTVKDLVPGSGLGFEDAGEHELKGIPDRWRLYRVAS